MGGEKEDRCFKFLQSLIVGGGERPFAARVGESNEGVSESKRKTKRELQGTGGHFTHTKGPYGKTSEGPKNGRKEITYLGR